MGGSENPLAYLFRYMWRFSEGRRRIFVLFTIMFFIANAISLLEPLVIGRVLNIIQEQGVTQETISQIIFTLALIVVIELSFWLFHGLGRVMEKKHAFYVRKNYKTFLLNGVLNLPTKWHTSHHSGDTIDKVEKAATSLHRFSNSTFEVFEASMMLIGSFIVLAIFDLTSMMIALLVTIVAIGIVLRLDKRLMKNYRKTNRLQNAISARVFDVINNVATVVILRVEKLMLKGIVKKIQKPFRVYHQTAKLSETKWFIVSTLTAVMIFLALSSYIYQNYISGAVIMSWKIVQIDL